MVVSTSIVMDFNSIKVQLKHSTYHDYNRSALFQFHKGTIKTLGGVQPIVFRAL